MDSYPEHPITEGLTQEWANDFPPSLRRVNYDDLENGKFYYKVNFSKSSGRRSKFFHLVKVVDKHEPLSFLGARRWRAAFQFLAHCFPRETIEWQSIPSAHIIYILDNQLYDGPLPPPTEGARDFYVTFFVPESVPSVPSLAMPSAALAAPAANFMAPTTFTSNNSTRNSKVGGRRKRSLRGHKKSRKTRRARSKRH